MGTNALMWLRCENVGNNALETPGTRLTPWRQCLWDEWGRETLEGKRIDFICPALRQGYRSLCVKVWFSIAVPERKGKDTSHCLCSALIKQAKESSFLQGTGLSPERYCLACQGSRDSQYFSPWIQKSPSEVPTQKPWRAQLQSPPDDRCLNKRTGLRLNLPLASVERGNKQIHSSRGAQVPLPKPHWG